MLPINTVLDNREGFTQRAHKGAQEARRAIHLLGFPSEEGGWKHGTFKIIVNCPVTFEDVKNTKLIFVPDVTSLKEKSVRHNPASVVNE